MTRTKSLGAASLENPLSRMKCPFRFEVVLVFVFVCSGCESDYERRATATRVLNGYNAINLYYSATGLYPSDEWLKSNVCEALRFVVIRSEFGGQLVWEDRQSSYVIYTTNEKMFQMSRRVFLDLLAEKDFLHLESPQNEIIFEKKVLYRVPSKN